MSKPGIAVYPGTFDPVTNGHMDIILRAAGLFDRLVIGVAVSAGKGPLFELADRMALLDGELRAAGNGIAQRVEVLPLESLLMHFCQKIGATVIVRGLRAVSDFEYEFQMAGMNRRLDAGVETVFLMASESNQFISSRFVKEIARLGGDIRHFVGPRVAARVRDHLARKNAGGADPTAPTMPVLAVRSPL